MAAVRQALTMLRDDHLQRLNDLHDDFDHTSKLWRMVLVRVERYGEQITFQNRVTGTRTTGQQLAGRAGGALRRLNEQTFKEIIGQFELFAGDFLRLWLTSHFHLVEAKALDVQTLFASNSLHDVQQAALREAVESTIQDKTYGRPHKWFTYLHRIVGVNAVSAQDIEAFAEMKASRDVIEHANGIANALYVDKAGGAARFKVGDFVTVDAAYHTAAFHLVQRLVRNIADAAIAVT